MKSKHIIVAKNIGFCFGVDRALKIAKENSPLFTIGNIIHNQYVVNELNKKYKITVNLNPPNNSKVLLRAHGVSLKEIKILKKKNVILLMQLVYLFKKFIILFYAKVEIIGLLLF